MQKRPAKDNQPTFAPGNEEEQLNQDATKKEIARGDYTEVTTLEFDPAPERTET
ncbi:hypothetical protein PP175_04855 [Aneurinibacillus sp. Ricciae_BoGa-3]|uniref:hypothetical protein n=1 Tax=Aneurinibacillus sp. Ricciae_BoGa-3 TaxID=3022697 RepID=UPI00234021A7|nr:hypothetical protein [Aneurinibacillus sp. Ricciae_BoGa-3]WCK55312.1 hypothetical protein PP175_04855 [Aneurinibacillus sp. Ricciae_BoGa-3]